MNKIDAQSPNRSARPRRGRFIKTALWIFAAVVGFILSFTTGAVIWLQSPAATQYALTKLRPILREKINGDLEFKQAQLAIMHGFWFEDLHFSMNTAKLKVDFRAPRAEFTYHWSPLHWRSLKITALKLDHGRIQVDQSPSAEDSEKPTETKSKSHSIGQLLESLPIEVTIENVAINALALEFHQRSQQSKIDFTSPNAELTFSANLDSRLLQAKSHFSLSHATLDFAKLAPASMRFHTMIDSSFEIAVRFHRESEQWFYDAGPIHLESTLSAVDIFQKPGAAWHLSQESLDLKGSLDSAHDRLHLDLQSLTQGLANKALLKSTTSARFDLMADVSRDFKKLKTQGSLTVQEPSEIGKLIEFAVDADAIAARIKVELDLKPKIGKLLPQLASMFQKTGELRPSLTATVNRKASGALDLDYNLRLPELHWPSFAQPFELASSGLVKFLPPSSRNEVQTFEVNSDLDVQQPTLGHWQLKTKSQFEKVNQEGRKDWRTTGTETLTEVLAAQPFAARSTQTNSPKPLVPIQFMAPVEISHRLASINGETSIEASVQSPGSIEWLSAPAQAPVKRVQSLLAKVKASLQPSGVFSLDQLNAVVNLETNRATTQISFAASGSGNSKTKNMQFATVSRLTTPLAGLSLGDQSLAGEVEIPATLAVSPRALESASDSNGLDVAILGQLKLSDVSIKKPELAVAGINGEVTFSEKIRLENGKVRFQALSVQNPFSRVDFERIRLLLQSNRVLRIESIRWFEKTYGPLITSLEIEQNLVSAHQFDLELGHAAKSTQTAGQIAGEMFFNADPKNLQYGLLARVTGLDLTQVLPTRFLARMVSGEKRLGARVGFIANLNKSSVDGRIDVTEIGGEQLVAMMNILDPIYSDEKMNQIRKALEYGFPTSVAVAMNEGYLDMTIHLSVLGVEDTETLYAIPVTGFISKATSSIVNQVAKGTSP